MARNQASNAASPTRRRRSVRTASHPPSSIPNDYPPKPAKCALFRADGLSHAGRIQGKVETLGRALSPRAYARADQSRARGSFATPAQLPRIARVFGVTTV